MVSTAEERAAAAPTAVQEDRATRVPTPQQLISEIPVQEDRATRVPTPDVDFMPILRPSMETIGPFAGRPNGPVLPMPSADPLPPP